MSRTRPLVSVIIPTHNRRDLLEETVGSVFRQTGIAWELIVVDDASEDDTMDYVESLTDGRVRGMRLDQNVGQSAARQTGTTLSTAEAIMFLDDDDLLRPKALARLHAALVRHPHAAAAVGANIEFDARGHRRRVRHPHRRSTRTVWRELLWGWSATPSRVLVRAQRLEASGGWDATIATAHDTELWLRMSLLGPFAFEPAAVVDKRAHPDQSRPVDTPTIQREFRQKFIDSLDDAGRAEAATLMRAREHSHKGEKLYLQGDMAGARREFVAAAKAAPSLLRSPLTRSYLTLDIGKATAAFAAHRLVGPSTTAALRKRAKAIAYGLKRDPGGDRKMKVRRPLPPPDERK